MANETHPDRHLPLEGSHNIRDLGGYTTADGRATRWRTLLRSGSMHELPVRSQDTLVDLGVRTVIDLRTTAEVADYPNVFARSSSVSFHHHNMIGDVPLDGAENVTAGGEFADGIVAVYCAFLDRRQAQVRETLATLAEPGALPAVYHCAGGKDRTGIISALLLGNAGVPRNTIAEDYALTARYLMDRYFREQARPGQTPENYTWRHYQAQFCPPEAMLKVLEHLDELYGGIQGYMDAIGLDGDQIGRLRDAAVQ